MTPDAEFITFTVSRGGRDIGEPFGDLAIDDIRITRGECDGGVQPTTPAPSTPGPATTLEPDTGTQYTWPSPQVGVGAKPGLGILPKMRMSH